MKKLTILFSICISSICTAFPIEDIYKNLDITTFNSSFLRKIPNGKTSFEDISSIPKPVFKDSSIIMEREEWIYTIQVFKENKRGFHICFTDQAKIGNYNSQQPMIIRAYDDKYVATRLYSDVCEKYAR